MEPDTTHAEGIEKLRLLQPAPFFQVDVIDPRVRNINGTINQFTRGSAFSAGYDLVAYPDKPVVLKPQAPAVLIPLGVKLYIKRPGIFGAIYPRSSTGHKLGLVMGNGTGVIDSDYQGPLFVSAWNRNPVWQYNENNHPMKVEGNDITINPGDRIGQIVFQPFCSADFFDVTGKGFDDETKRAEGGFGSTGR